MSKKWFRCPDGCDQEITACFAKCRMAMRCAPMPYLHHIGDPHEGSGLPSVTELLNGTRYSYLHRTTDYVVSPDGSAFAVSGSAAHAALEGDSATSEVRVQYEGISGRFDHVEVEEDGLVLIDYKTSGSYAVAKAIGVTTEEEPLLDSEGNPVMWRGKARVTKRHILNPEKAELRDWGLQLNFYRLALERGSGKNVKAMRLFFIVRDGGTVTAKGRGVVRNTYYIDVPRMHDEDVLAWFALKKSALESALASGIPPAPCNSEEAWGGRRCGEYCSVAQSCVALGDNPYVNTERREEE